MSKTAKDVGAYRVDSTSRLGKLVDYVIDEIYAITEYELSRIYPEKNWYDDNFGANLFSMALQLTSNIQTEIVMRRAKEVTEKKK